MDSAEVATGQILWQRQSYYADVVCYVGDDKATVVKTIMPKHLEGLSGGDRAQTAHFINRAVAHFREQLAALKVPLADPYECRYVDGKVIHICPYAGPTVAQSILAMSHDEQRRWLARVLESMDGVLDQVGPPRVGIDARLSNFSCGSNEQAIYIDVFPALCWFEGRFLVHWPNPSDAAIVAKELERKFQWMGILRRLRFDVLETDPSLERIFYAALREVLGAKKGGAAIEFFEELPDRKVASATPDELIAIIDGLTVMTTDQARELALRLIPDGPGRREAMARVFDLSSSFSRHGISPEARLPQLKELLKTFVPT